MEDSFAWTMNFFAMAVSPPDVVELIDFLEHTTTARDGRLLTLHARAILVVRVITLFFIAIAMFYVFWSFLLDLLQFLLYTPNRQTKYPTSVLFCTLITSSFLNERVFFS